MHKVFLWNFHHPQYHQTPPSTSVVGILTARTPLLRVRHRSVIYQAGGDTGTLRIRRTCVLVLQALVPTRSNGRPVTNFWQGGDWWKCTPRSEVGTRRTAPQACAAPPRGSRGRRRRRRRGLDGRDQQNRCGRSGGIQSWSSCNEERAAPFATMPRVGI